MALGIVAAPAAVGETRVSVGETSDAVGDATESSGVKDGTKVPAVLDTPTHASRSGQQAEKSASSGQGQNIPAPTHFAKRVLFCRGPSL